MEIMLERAEALRAKGRLAQAAAAYERMLENRGASPRDKLKAHIALAALDRSLGFAARSRGHILAGLRLARRLEATEDIELLRLEQAMLLRAEGRYAESLDQLGRFLDLFRRRGDWEGAGFVLWAMGGALRFSGNLEGSQRAFLRSIEAFRRARDSSGSRYAVLGLAGLKRIRGDVEGSRRLYAGALGKARSDGDLFGLAYAHCGLANALRQLGRMSEARSHYRSSGRLYRRLGDAVDGAYVDWGMGQVEWRSGRPARAGRLFARALAAFKGARETRGEVLALMALASIRYLNGHRPEGIALYERAARAARKAGILTPLEFFT